MGPGIGRREVLGLLTSADLSGCSDVGTGGVSTSRTPRGVSPTEPNVRTERGEPAQPPRTEADAGRNLGAGSWPQFQHDDRNSGHAGAVEGPKRDVEALWRVDTGDSIIRSSPVVFDDTVYVGSGTGVHALDLTTGTERWKFDTDGPVIAAPTVVDGSVHVVSVVGTAYRLDRGDGAERWTFRSGVAQQPYRPASPAVAGGLLVFGTSDGLFAVAAGSGSRAWTALTREETGVHGAIEAKPAVVDGVVYVGHASGMTALTAADGEIMWQTPLHPPGVASSPAVDGDRVFVGARDGNVYLYDRHSGEEMGRFVNEFEPDLHEGVADEITTSPAIADGVVYAGSEDFHAYAWDIDSGERLWRRNVGGRCYTSPGVVDGVVHVGGIGGTLRGLDARTGDVHWSYHAGTQIVDSSPAVVDGIVVFGDGNGVIHAIVEG